ncbi:hypothetical protein [Zhihengliuella sp.]|uniref:hypothetical protein n=1 Tax=Zhihengliuella sp. TaxID=1954483 RepID=UPI00281200FB|nr:hypothetical protein [Zhihengliuella sp.]
MDQHSDDPQEQRAQNPRSIDVEVRRSPRFWPFMAVGAVLGFIAALISAYTGEPHQEFTRGSVAAFLAVIFGIIGVFLACLAYLLVDRSLRRRTRRLQAVRVDGASTPDGAGAADRARGRDVGGGFDGDLRPEGGDGRS